MIFLTSPSSSPSDWIVELPDKAFHIQNNETRMVLRLVSYEIVRSWYNVQAFNQTLTVNGNALTIPTGSYDVYSLLATLQGLCTPLTVSVSYNEQSNGFTFSGSGSLVLGAGSARLLGFDAGTFSLPATSTRPALMGYPFTALLHTSLPQMDGGITPSVGGTDIIGRLAFDCAPFDIATFYDPLSAYWIDVAGPSINSFRLWLTTEDAEALSLNHPWTLSLACEFMEPTDSGTDSLKKIEEYTRLQYLSNPPGSVG